MHDLENKIGINIRGICDRLPMAGIKSFLILLTVGLWCFQSHGATNVFETPPPKIGSIQWENLQRLAKERQELYRKRVPVPGAMSADVPRAGGGNFATSPKIMAAQTQSPQPPTAAHGMPYKILFFVVVFAFIGILVARKFAHHILADLNQRFNPWALEPSLEKGLPAKVRAEEEAFAEFLATFRIGPSASPLADSLAKNDSPEEFYARAAKLLGTQRMLLDDIGQESSDLVRQKLLASLRSEMSSLKGHAGFP